MKAFHAILVLCLFLLSLPSQAQSVEEKLLLPEDPLPFGKPAELVLTLSWPKNSGFQPPKVEELKIPEGVILDRFAVDLGLSGSEQSLEYHLVFTRFEPGLFVVGPVKLGDDDSALRSQAKKMTFTGSQAKDSDKEGEIREAKDFAEISTRDFWENFAAWFCGLLFVLAFLATLVYRFKLLDRFRSPKNRALKRLKAAENLEPEARLLSCVEIHRRYLEKAYGLKTREATSSEIHRQLTLDNRCHHLKAISKELFQLGDHNKFAGNTVIGPEISDLSQRLRNLLEEEKKVQNS